MNKFQINFILPMLNFLILIIFMLVSVAFITLLERKILGLMQLRLGPNKVGMFGILQPFSDAIKLYTKEYNKPFVSNKSLFFLFPMFSLLISLFIWIMMPYMKSMFFLNLSLILFLLLIGMGVYSILFMGWSSNSNYSNIGSIRSVAQTISYEISLSFIILSVFFFNKNLNFYFFMNSQMYIWNLFLIPMFFMWLISCLAELNRTPFDLAEAESELVSGFNTEFSGGKFALIFMAEYMMIIILSNFTSILFLGSNFKSILFFLNSSMIMIFIIWMRATLPRIRYDKLMTLTWKIFLPSSMLILMIIFSLYPMILFT